LNLEIRPSLFEQNKHARLLSLSGARRWLLGVDELVHDRWHLVTAGAPVLGRGMAINATACGDVACAVRWGPLEHVTCSTCLIDAERMGLVKLWEMQLVYCRRSGLYKFATSSDDVRDVLRRHGFDD